MVPSAFFFLLLNHRTHLVFTAILSFFLFFFFFFVLHHRTHLVFATGGDGGDRRRPDRRYISSSFVQVQSSLHQFWICAGPIVAASILGLWRSDCHCRSDRCCGYWGLKEKKKRNAWCRCKLRQRSSQGKRNVRKFAGLHLLCSSCIWVRVFFFPLLKLVWYFMRGGVRAEDWIKAK